MILLRIIILLIRKTKNNLININININNIICYISSLLKERIVVLRFIFIYFYIYYFFISCKYLSVFNYYRVESLN